MPSTDDFFNRLGETNDLITQLHSDLTSVKASVDAVDSTLQTGLAQLNATMQLGFGELVTLGTYTNQALFQESQQNDTIICILEQISKQTCDLLNQAALQTALQETIDRNTTTLAALFEAVHPEATLAREREERLRAQIEACCPTPEPPPACSHEPCVKPEELPPPPKVGPGPIE